MAIDSQQKRMSAAGAGRPWMRAVFPVATPTQAWRISAGLNYAGNAIAAPGGVIPELLQLPHHMRGGFNRLHGGFSS